MNWLFTVVLVVMLLFGLVVLFGAPYLPTLRPQAESALDLLNLQPGQKLLELGSGDGRVLKAAAQKGWSAVGYELNPLLVLISLAVTWSYRKQVKVVWANYWRAQWPAADGLYIFLLPKYMERLDKKITRELSIKSKSSKGLKVVSFAFIIPGRQPEKEQDGLFLYRY